MAQGSGNVSNILNVGGAGTVPAPLMIPEANSQGYFCLYGGGNVTNNGFGPLVKNGVAYQVPNGKTCKVVGGIFACSAAGDTFQLCSATSTIAQQAGSLTGGVYQGGAAAISCIVTAAASIPTVMGITYSFAQNTFAGWQNVASGTNYFSIILVCKEV